MLQARRGGAEVWVTAITGILSGENFCRFRPWTQAHYWVRNTSGEFDRAAWIAEHAQMLQAEVKRLTLDGYACAIEKQNAFTLHGKTAKLSGKPDIIATRTVSTIEPGGEVIETTRIVREARVLDCKTGKKKNEHLWQMYEYLLALPRVRPDLSGFTWTGELIYKDQRVLVTSEEAERAKADVFALVREMGFSMPPDKTPSESECEECPLGIEDCSEKAKMVGTRAVGDTVEF